MENWEEIKRFRDLDKQQHVEKSISAIGSDHLPIMISSRYRYGDNDFCMASWNVLSLNHTLSSMGQWNIKKDLLSNHIDWKYDRDSKMFETLDMDLLKKRYAKDTLIINHLKKCLLTCDCTHGKKDTRIPKMDVLSLQEVDVVLLQHLEYNFGFNYYILSNINIENHYKSGTEVYGIDDDAWCGDGVALLVNKSKYEIIPEEEVKFDFGDYYKGLLVPFKKKKKPRQSNLFDFWRVRMNFDEDDEDLEEEESESIESIVIFGSLHMSNSFDREHMEHLAVVKDKLDDLNERITTGTDRVIGYALGLDSNQFNRRINKTIVKMNKEIKSVLDMEVYYPTYHSAVGGRNPIESYAIDLIITNVGLLVDTYDDYDAVKLKENILGLNYSICGERSIVTNPGTISFDDNNDVDGGFVPIIRKSEKSAYAEKYINHYRRLEAESELKETERRDAEAEQIKADAERREIMNDKYIDTIVAMGFSAEQAQNALLATGGNLESGINWILSQ